VRHTTSVIGHLIPDISREELCLYLSVTIDFWTRSHIIENSVPEYIVFRNSCIIFYLFFCVVFGNDFNNSDQTEPHASAAGK
jgi:hypothetical protein